MPSAATISAIQKQLRVSQQDTLKKEKERKRKKKHTHTHKQAHNPRWNKIHGTNNGSIPQSITCPTVKYSLCGGHGHVGFVVHRSPPSMPYTSFYIYTLPSFLTKSIPNLLFAKDLDREQKRQASETEYCRERMLMTLWDFSS